MSTTPHSDEELHEVPGTAEPREASAGGRSTTEPQPSASEPEPSTLEGEPPALEEGEPLTSEPELKKPYRPWLGRVDRYIMRTFLTTFLFSIGLILAVAVVFDVNDKITDFLKPEVPLSAIFFEYYLNFIPYYANLFSPLFVFISVIFFTSTMAGNSEIIAMLASGMSFRRLLRPYMVTALIIASFTYVLNGFVIPAGNRVRLDFEQKYLKSKTESYTSNIQIAIAKDTYLYIRDYESLSRVATSLAVDQFKGHSLISRMTSDEAVYDTLDRWHLKDFHIRRFEGLKATDTVGYELDTNLRIRPSDFLVNEKDVAKMRNDQLSRYIDRQRERGASNTRLFQTELHNRYAAIFSAFILTFIGAVLSAKKVKNGLGINLVIGFSLCLAYILATSLTAQISNVGLMAPWIAAWLPNIAFVLAALFLWRKAPQ